MRSNSISFAPEIIDFHEATLFSNFCLCERRAPPRVDVARFQEMTKVSLTSFGRSCTTRRTLEAIAVRSASTPWTCLACQPHSVPSLRFAYHSTPPSGLPVRIARDPDGTYDLSN